MGWSQRADDAEPALDVGVIADDLSGGADCGVSFAHTGLATAIQLDRRAVPPAWARAVVVPTDSRDEESGVAGAVVREAVAMLAARRPAVWFKKIDSTLRGQLAAELTVMASGVGSRLPVVASAFPAHGRTVVGGHGFLDGVPLERTRVWRAQGLDGPASLPDMLGRGGLRVRGLSLAEIRSGQVAQALAAASGGAADVVVCDAETEADLDIITAGGLAAGRDLLWVGSAGLAQHLAWQLARFRGSAGEPGGEDRAAPDRGTGPWPPADRGPVAVVVGSAAAAANAQFRYLATRPGTRIVPVDPAALLADGTAELAAADRAIGAALRAGQDVAVGLVPAGGVADVVLDAVTSRTLSRALGELIGRHRAAIGGFVLTGGDTALAVLAACGVTTLRPVAEVVTGVPVSESQPDGRLAVTKAGAFGGERVLAQAIDVLRGRAVPPGYPVRAAGAATARP